MGNKRRLIETFKKLVMIDSESGNERAISDYLVTYLRKLKIAVTRDKAFNVFAKIPGRGEPLFLSAHMDTVSPGSGIKPQVKGDIITSAGDTILGADNKSSLTVILELVNILQEINVGHHPLELLFTVQEEKSLLGAQTFDYSLLSARHGLIADISQPLGTIVIAAPYCLRFEAAFIGRFGHAAFPEKAKNVGAAVGAALQIAQGHIDSESIRNIGIVAGGNVINAVMGRATLDGEIRSYSKRLFHHHAKQTEKLFGSIAKKAGVKLKFSVHSECPGYVFDPDSGEVSHISAILRKAGLKPKLIKGFSASDGNIFNHRGMQVVNVGDGSEKTHTVDESIKISDMQRLVEVFYSFATQK